MWIGVLSRCIIILYYLEITNVSVFPLAYLGKDWFPNFPGLFPIYKLKGSYVNNENFQKARALQALGAAGNNKLKLKSSQDNILDKNTAGFDFDDKEMEKLKLWPGGIIPYYIDKISYDKVFRDKIRLFLEKVNNLGTLQFIELLRAPADDDTRWVMFLNRRGALTSDDYTPKNFTTKSVQVVVLGYDCFTNGDIFPVVLAIAGVPPQHMAPNRDKYIEVKTENILPDKRYLFEVLKDDEWLFHDIKYDFESAGHFDFHKHTSNGQATIVPRIGDSSLISKLKLGHAREFSVLDILKMRILYNYISVNRVVPLRKSACKKMFKPGSEFVAFESKREKLKSMSPREKPNKYLGLPDDNNSKDDDTQTGQNDNDGDIKPGNNDEIVADLKVDETQPGDNDPNDDAKEGEEV